MNGWCHASQLNHRTWSVNTVLDIFCILFHFDKEGITFFHVLSWFSQHTSILEHLFDIKKCHAILDDNKHPLPFHFPPHSCLNARMHAVYKYFQMPWTSFPLSLWYWCKREEEMLQSCLVDILDGVVIDCQMYCHWWWIKGWVCINHWHCMHSCHQMREYRH